MNASRHRTARIVGAEYPLPEGRVRVPTLLRTSDICPPIATFDLGIVTLGRRFVLRHLSEMTVRERKIDSATGPFPVGHGWTPPLK